MTSVPTELLEEFERGNLLLFVGELVSQDPQGQPVINQLAARLAGRCGITNEELPFPEIAQVYEDMAGRSALVRFVRDGLEALGGDEPQTVHRRIAGLTDCDVLVTTCLDQRLEMAFKEAGRPLDTIIDNLDLPYEDRRKAELYKLCGSRERVESMVLTRDQYEAFEHQTSTSVVLIVLQGYLARKTTLFLGYDLADPHFQRLYRKVITPLDTHARRAYALFAGSPSPAVSGWCRRRGIHVIEVELAEFLEALTEQLAARARPAPFVPTRPHEEPAPPLTKLPYKFLDYYGVGDADIFFGRRRETQMLSSLIHARRLVLLHGASGVGKTSLLLAGVVPRLERAEPPYETIYVRALVDPALVIRRAVRRRLPEVHLPEDGDLVGFLDAAARSLDRTLVIIFDQFEEFFIRLSPQSQAAFISEMGALHDAREVPVKIVLSLREDWLAAVSGIAEQVPEVFHNRMQLPPLTRDQARAAITSPVERLGASYESALVERLLDDLVGDESATVMPPQLQIVCSVLYGRLRPGESAITVAAYEQLGGARGLLQGYLNAELTRLGSDERTLAYGVLEELVTSQGTKAVKTGDELALALEASLSQVASVLRKLMGASLLRSLRREDGGIAYELAHEYLIREIGLGAEAQKRKQAEELVHQEMENWQRFGTLLAADKLALVNRIRGRLRLDAAAQELLLRSALVRQHESSAYWLERVEDEGRRAAIARECVADDRVAVRAWTAQVLGTWGVPVAGDVLADLIQSDPHPEVRSKAALNLAQTDGPRLVNCVQEMLEGPPDHQQWALEAIDLIQHAAPEVLNPGQLARFDLRQRLRRLRLRRNRARRSRNTLYAALGGVLGAAIGGTAGAALSLSPSQMPWLPYFALLSILIGLATGIGAGLGFGTVEAMDERRRFPYVTGAALGGGIGCMVVGGIGGLGISTYHILIGAAIGLAGGITSGGGAAVVANLTANIASPARRLAMRLALGLIAGIIPGAVFVLGGHLEAMALKELPYGLGLGMLLTSGIAGGLELAGRGLGPTHQPGESARSSDIEKARIERKGDQI